jgi:CheY-like chemotaxis protein
VQAEENKMPKILLVEDNEMNQDMLSRPMVRRGYEACLLRMAPKGWRRRQLRQDLVLIDMSLPVLNGWKATRGSSQRRRHDPFR